MIAGEREVFPTAQISNLEFRSDLFPVILAFSLDRTVSYDRESVYARMVGGTVF